MKETLPICYRRVVCDIGLTLNYTHVADAQGQILDNSSNMSFPWAESLAFLNSAHKTP